MLLSKPNILLLILALVFGLSACNIPKPSGRDNQDSEGSATFFVESSDGEVISERVHESISFPKAKTYRFSICFKDQTYSKPIVGAAFRVVENDQEIKSDAKGCVIWTEEVEFNALARPNYLYFERNIQGLGIHRGQRKMKLAINPWSDGKDLKQALDMSKKVTAPQYIEDKEKARLALFSDTDEPRHLWINEGRLSIIQRQFIPGATKLRVEFNTTPYLELVNINRVNYKKALSEADVSVEMHLIQVKVETKNGKSHEVRYNLSDNSKETQIFKIRNGELNVPSNLILPDPSTEGQLILGIKINVLNQPKGLSPIAEFNGLYTIGGYHQLIGRTYVSLVPESISKPGDKPFTIDDYLQEAVPPSNKDGRQRARINIERMLVDFRGYGKEINNEREVKFKITACMTNSLDLRNVQAQTFRIKHFQIDPDSPSKHLAYSQHGDTFISEEKKTSTDSCVTWDDSFMFKHLACSRHIRGKIHVINENLAVDEKLDVAINPWETEWNEFGRDIRAPYGSASQMQFDCNTNNRQEPHLPRLFIKSFEWSDHGLPKYSVDNDLSLTIERPIKLTLSPKLNIYTHKHGRFSEGELRPGIYLAKVALLRPISERKVGKTPLITWQNKLVAYNGETLVNTFNFKIRDLFGLGNLNEILFEFYPVDRNKIMFDANGQPQPISTIKDINVLIDRTSEYVSPTFAANIALDKGGENQNAHVISTDDLALLVAGGPRNILQKNEFVIDRLVAQNREIEAKQMAEFQKKTLGVRMRESGLILMSPYTPASVENLTRALGAGQQLAHRFKNQSFSPDEYEQAFARASNKDLELLRKFIDSDTLDAPQAQTLCAYFVTKFYRQYFGDTPFNHGRAAGMAEACMALAEKEPTSVFSIENKYLVTHVAETNDLQVFSEENIQFNTQFSFSSSHALSTNEQNQGSVNTNLNGGFSARSALLSFNANIGLGGSHQISRSEQESETESTSAAANNQMSLSVEVIPINIKVDRYQTCRVVRMNPGLFADSAYRWYSFIMRWLDKTPTLRGYLNSQMKPEQIVNLISSGLMICSDIVKTDPIVLHEEFFMFDQVLPTNGKAKNNRDPRSRHFFFPVRGRADFHRMKMIARENILLPMTYTSHDQSLNDQFHKIHKSFQIGVPVLPGFISRPVQSPPALNPQTARTKL